MFFKDPARRAARRSAAALAGVAVFTFGGVPAWAAVPADGPPTPPRLTLTKHASKAKVRPNEKVGYTLTVRNVGMVPAFNVRLTDRLPAGLEVVTAPRGCAKSAAQVSCHWRSVAYRKSITLHLTAKVKADTKPQRKLTNKARLSYAGHTASASAAIEVLKPPPPPKPKPKEAHNTVKTPGRPGYSCPQEKDGHSYVPSGQDKDEQGKKGQECEHKPLHSKQHHTQAKPKEPKNHYSESTPSRHDNCAGTAGSTGQGQNKCCAPGRSGNGQAHCCAPGGNGQGQAHCCAPGSNGQGQAHCCAPGSNGQGQAHCCAPGSNGQGQNKCCAPGYNGQGQGQAHCCAPGDNGQGQHKCCAPAGSSSAGQSQGHCCAPGQGGQGMKSGRDCAKAQHGGWLPRTGGPVLWMVGLSLATIALGAAMVFLAFRRNALRVRR
ncbi:DUF11 domain-containing protein [Actinomadura macrotermitis]|uniref:DUF11 domain-containing protein n=1 Tax=Actinomadura macrotermitis TaxID=2585200 RepID=A0A7K0BSM0_9ACTN|nr:DUF11 domain-containing protein [Actinomadura macrotermitis]MQY03674.1 hypothetical protein [Actinomadura macrotermitis]